MLPICLDEATKIAGEILRALQLLKLMSEDRRAEFQTQDATA
jgi:hypothetical protein